MACVLQICSELIQANSLIRAKPNLIVCVHVFCWFKRLCDFPDLSHPWRTLLLIHSLSITHFFPSPSLSLSLPLTLLHNEFNSIAGVNHNNADMYTVYAMQYGYNIVSCNLMKNETPDIHAHMHTPAPTLTFTWKFSHSHPIEYQSIVLMLSSYTHTLHIHEPHTQTHPSTNWQKWKLSICLHIIL